MHEYGSQEETRRSVGRNSQGDEPKPDSEDVDDTQGNGPSGNLNS